MKQQVLITTTNTIQGGTIIQYLDLISTHVVIGANFFSDLKASFTDFFGGRSGTYQKKLKEIYNAALSEMQREAACMGANAVVGLKIDFDEISGKGVSMFMVSAVGTAVKVEYSHSEIDRKDLPSQSVSCDDLQLQVDKTIIIDNINAGKKPSEATWDYLFRNPINDIFSELLDFYIKSCAKSPTELFGRDVLLLERFPTYCGLIDQEIAENFLYLHLQRDIKHLSGIIIECKLMSPTQILKLIEEDQIPCAIACLSADKEYYTKDDLAQMRHIADRLEALPAQGEVKDVKGMMSTKKRYVCPNGHKSDPETVFCPECGMNTQGLTEGDFMQINKLKRKISALELILKN